MKVKKGDIMNEVIRLFNQIKETSSTNDKVEVIKSNSDNELFKQCLVFLLDNMVITGISNAKINKNVYGSTKPLDTFLDVIDYLSNNKTGRDEDITQIQSFINNQPIEHQEFYKQMITKSLKLGCDAKLVNKAIPNLIPTFDLMLGTPIDKCKLNGDEFISLSHKLNGTRCAFVNGKLMTRQGKEYIGLDHIINEISELNLSDFFIDGELIYKNEEGLSDSGAFQKGTGIAMSKDTDKSSLKLVIFEIFEPSNSKLNYSMRSKNLIKFNKQLSNVKHIEFLTPLYQGYDHSQIWKWLDYAEENDWEGIMINLDTSYEFKRTKNLIKVKKFHSCDIRCVGVEEGSGRNKGVLGALVCKYKNNLVNVGSGFSDELRREIWNNPSMVTNKIISVKYKEETTNKNGGVSIQFPVFECVRMDKDEESYN